MGNCDLKVIIGKTAFNAEFLTVANTLMLIFDLSNVNKLIVFFVQKDCDFSINRLFVALSRDVAWGNPPFKFKF